MPSADLKDFYAATRQARSIIVVDLGFLGDSVHLTPALWEIKRHYPNARLDVLAAPVGSEVLALVPCVDRAWAFPLGPSSPAWWRHWDVIRALRREHYDLAFNFSGADRTIFLTALTGAKWRVAHSGSRRHFWNTWLIPFWLPRQEQTLPVFEQRRQVLAACGFSLASPRFGLKPKCEDVEWASKAVPKRAIHLSLSSTNPLREWPVGHYANLVRGLWSAWPDQRFVASASSNAREQKRLREFASALADTRLQVLEPTLTISRLVATLQCCCLHIGPDSGVIHLAMALGVPSISFFRQRGDYTGWLPPGKMHRVFVEPCTCEDDRTSLCQQQGRAACLARISPERAIAAAKELLQR